MCDSQALRPREENYDDAIQHMGGATAKGEQTATFVYCKELRASSRGMVHIHIGTKGGSCDDQTPKPGVTLHSFTVKVALWFRVSVSAGLVKV